MVFLNNNRGAAILLAVLSIVILVSILINSLTTQLSEVSQQITLQKRIMAGREALRDFATIAARSNEMFDQINGTGGTNNCGPGHTQLPPNRRFCFPNAGSPNDEECIRHPLYPDDATRILCLTYSGANDELEIQARIPDSLPFLEKAERHMVALLELVAERWTYYNLAANNQAIAQGLQEPHWPNLTGSPNMIISANLDCNNAAIPNPPPPLGAFEGDPRNFCKRCRAGQGLNADRMECITLKVCLREGLAACQVEEYVYQTVGIIPRGL